MFKIHLLRFFLKIFWIFPVNKKKAFFSSFDGKRQTCNPKYIYQYLLDNKYDLKYIWELNNKKGKGYVKHNSLRFIFHVLTSKYVISNGSISPILPIRTKKQIVVNTWHGAGAYKRIGKVIDSKINGTTNERQRMINKQTNYFLSGCEKFSYYVSDSLEFPYERFLPTGMPRNSVFFQNINILELKKKYGFEDDVHICLYAPTFRGNTGEKRDETYAGLDADKMVEALQTRFGGKWIFATRCHYHYNTSPIKNALDLSSVEEMQDLLLICDILISDYSSSLWDYCLTLKPCFIYCYDLDKYKSERDFYMPIEQWGFPLAQNFQELIDAILTFDEKDFQKKMKKHQEDLGSFEGPDSAKKAVDIIFGKKQNLNTYGKRNQ